MSNEQYINQIIQGDSITKLAELESNSVDLVLTDPPYFLDKLDENWTISKVMDKRNQQVIKSLPAGMKFDREQGKRFYDWYLEISKQLLRILKPGGFFFSFSSPRLYHRMASAIDDAGFDIRDAFLWIYTQNQAKAMSLDHFIEKMNLDSDVKARIKLQMDGWKTPQIKSCYEPIALAQKPVDKTFLNNMIINEVGLINTKVKVGQNMYPSNILATGMVDALFDRYFLISKPNKEEKSSFNVHMTVKPLELCMHLIMLAAYSKNAVVLDPFMGSGTTGLAARLLGLNYIGIELNAEYIDVANARIRAFKEQDKLQDQHLNF